MSATAPHVAPRDAAGARELTDALRAARERARATGRRQWLVAGAPASAADPLALLGAAGEEDRFYWEQPAAGRWLVARGAAAALEEEGAGRLERVGRAVEALLADLRLVGAGARDLAPPLLVGGGAFADAAPAGPAWRGFPAARWVLPEALVVGGPDGVRHLAVQAVGADDDPDALARSLRRRLDAGFPVEVPRTPERETGLPPRFEVCPDRAAGAFRAGVARAVEAIARGQLEKVVLARSLSLRPLPPGGAVAVIAALRARHPGCTLFAAGRGDGVFLGATPERLLRLDGASGAVETAAVAGSAPRGRDPEEDARLARRLRESKKDQAEHAVVVRALREALARSCERIEGPEAPRVLELGGIRHLETPLRARRRRPETSLLELAGALHPTPAVGGAPREAALAWLRRNEDLERGWYAGPLGFVDARGGGELVVALRSALLRGGAAHLYAGAGVVEGSDPAAELRETRLKLQTLLSVLLEV